VAAARLEQATVACRKAAGAEAREVLSGIVEDD
jgi:hypothetical protein